MGNNAEQLAVQGSDAPDISVVIPCLNEERTVSACVRAALDGIAASGLRGEVIVADNGSTDQSRARARAAGARVVPVARRGYGAALQAGFLAAEGDLLVMGDADLSYDFRHIPRFVEEWRRSGADMVVGNRFAGGIMRGAMPLSHRFVGNPLISWTLRRVTGVKLRDCYCGLRMITRGSHRQLKMTATGMEYALEMIVKASLAGMSLAEVPTTLRVDGRDNPPHLRTFRDGYRSFRFLFQHATIQAFLLPGMIMGLVGLVGLGVESWRQLRIPNLEVGFPLAVWTLLLVLGGNLVIVGMISRVFAGGYLGSQVEVGLQRFFRVLHLESGVLISAALLAGGAGALVAGMGRSEALMLLGGAISFLSIQAVLSAFVVSLMGRAVPDNRFYLESDARPQEQEGDPEVSGDSPPGGQNVGHSLATQQAMAEGTDYNRWLFEAVAPALDGSRRVLDVGCSIGNITALALEHIRNANADQSQPCEIVGLDVIPEAIARFEERFAGESGVASTLGDIRNPPEELRSGEAFDGAISLNVFEHIEDDIGALRALGSMLEPGAKLGLLVPGGGHRIYGTLDALDRHFRRYTPGRLRVRLEEAGYEVISMRPVNFLGYFLWFVKGRILRSQEIRPDEVKRFDRWVAFLRRVDAMFGPPTGQSLAAIARWRGE